MTGKKKRTIILAIAAVLLALVVWTVWGNTALELNTYTVGSKELPDAFDGYRIAHVSDLHNAEMGDGNEKLLAVLREIPMWLVAWIWLLAAMPMEGNSDCLLSAAWWPPIRACSQSMILVYTPRVTRI